MKIKRIILAILCLIGATISAQDCAQCATHLLKAQQINHLSMDNLRLLINEIYARKGYVFKDWDYAHYFEQQQWYKPLNDNKKITLNDTEEKNVQLLKERIKQKESQQAEIIRQFKDLQQLVLSDNWEVVQRQYFHTTKVENPKSDESPMNKDSKNYLKKVLRKMDFDELRFYQDQGLYQITLDNGQQEQLYRVRISEKDAELAFHILGNSDLIKQDKDRKLAYRQEFIEVAYFWIFEFKNNQLQLVNYAIAG